MKSISVLLLCIMQALFVPWEAEAMTTARDLFEMELTKRHVPYSPPDEHGLYKIVRGDLVLEVYLDNISRIYQRDKDPSSIARFVDQVLSTGKRPLPKWESASQNIYFSAESNSYDYGNAIHDSISETVSKVLVLTDIDEGKLTWITPDILTEWKVSEKTVREYASHNMNRLLEGKNLEVQLIDGMKLGMVPVESVFKASVIFAPTFKAFVSSELTWPVLAVVPCRDFIYVISEKDAALLNRMGRVVQKEFRESGYPITTEVLRVSDEGIKAVGEFPK